MFEIFDTDGKGTLDINELELAIYALGFTDREHACNMASDFMKQIVHDETGEMKLKDFKELMHGKLAGRDPAAHIRAIFNVLSEPHAELKGKKVISQGSLEKIVRQLRLSLSEDEIKDMIRGADRNKDGFVEEPEFVLILENSAWM